VLGNLREGRIIYHHRWRALAAGAALIASSLLGVSIVLSSFSEARPVTASGAAHSPTGPCPGTQVEPTRNATYRGKRVGALRVYYDPSTGKNCARMDHTRRTWGKARMTYVYIRICRGNRRPGDRCRGGTRGVADAGTYKYYAGPVITKRSARGRCIFAQGMITVRGHQRWAVMDPPVDHCGG
jgi:hypothetical protein